MRVRVCVVLGRFWSSSATHTVVELLHGGLGQGEDIVDEQVDRLGGIHLNAAPQHSLELRGGGGEKGVTHRVRVCVWECTGKRPTDWAPRIGTPTSFTSSSPGTRYFFLEISGVSLLAAFSAIIWGTTERTTNVSGVGHGEMLGAR